MPDGAHDPSLTRLAENGDVLGRVLVGDTGPHGVVWHDALPVDLGSGEPVDLEAGHVVANVADGVRYWPTFTGTATALSLPAGSVGAQAVDLNAAGTVAGVSTDGDGRRSVVVWPSAGAPVVVLTVAGADTVRVTRVTENGLVFGDVREAGGAWRIWRWEPAAGLSYVLKRPTRPERGYLEGPLAAVSAQGRWLVAGEGGETVGTVWSEGQGIRAVITASGLGVQTAEATHVTDQGVVGGSMQEWTTGWPRGWRWDHRFGLVGEPWSGAVSDMNVLGDHVSAERWWLGLCISHGPRLVCPAGAARASEAPQINDVGQVAVTEKYLDENEVLQRVELVVWS
jgi:hypothetical protein